MGQSRPIGNVIANRGRRPYWLPSVIIHISMHPDISPLSLLVSKNEETSHHHRFDFVHWIGAE